MIKRFRLKPLYVEAIQFTGRNDRECLSFCPSAYDPEDTRPSIIVKSIGGDMKCEVFDWIVKKSDNDFYVCKDSNISIIF